MPGAANAKVLRILYVDDSPDERALMIGIAASLALPVDLTALPGLPEVKLYLTHVRAPTLPLPDIILLDYNLDGHTGADVLPIIHSNSLFSSIPVVMFTGSEDVRDIAACYRAGANCYLKKPDSPVRTKAILETLRRCLLTAPRCYEELKSLPEYRASPATMAINNVACSLPRRRRTA